MIVLALDCSTKVASVSAANGARIVTKTSDNPKGHSETLNKIINCCLEELGLNFSEIDRIAVTIGPGSFTGIRVALSIAKALGYSLKIPIYTIDTLTLLSKNNLSHDIEITYSMINAHKNMVFFSAFKKEEVLFGPAAMTMQDLKSFAWQDFGPGLSLGDGFEAYRDRLDPLSLSHLQRDSSISDFPSSETLAKLVLSSAKIVQPIDWKLLQPLYLRASEAEENLKLTKKF